VDFDLSEDMRILQQTSREFALKELAPAAIERDARQEYPVDAMNKLGELGFMGVMVPEQYGGSELGMLAYCVIMEEIARWDASVALNMAAQNSLCLGHLMVAANEEQKQRYVAPLARGEQLGAWGLTEAGSGSDAASMRTTARLDGDEWVINGHKIWPSSASVSDLTYLTVCTTDPDSGDEGIALIHVPPDSKGLSFSQPLEKMGMCWTDINAEIFYDDVRVPKENRLRGPGADAQLLHDIVGIGRLGTCPYAVGAAQACFEIVVEYTMSREIAGKPVRSRSLHAAIVGEMAQRIDCARAFYQRVSDMQRTGKFGRPGEPVMLSKSSAAHNYACDTAIWVVNKAMELMGSYGYAFGYEIEKYYRDVKILQLWLGGPQRRSLDTALGYYSFEW